MIFFILHNIQSHFHDYILPITSDIENKMKIL